MTKIIYLVIGFLLGSAIYGQAREFIADFSDQSLPVLNQEIRRMNAILNDHEARIVALEP